MQRILSKVFGTSNDRAIKRLLPLVDRVNVLEGELSKLSDADLRGRTPLYRQRLEQGEPLDDLLPEAFATVREAAKRSLGQRHYDVQLIGGIVLHQGRIAEMKTGEGKTLVATLPVLSQRVWTGQRRPCRHRERLSSRSRDAEWMGQVYSFLGLDHRRRSCHGVDRSAARRAAYAMPTSPTATNNELGFDYLRDNMKYQSRAELRAAPSIRYAIVDEVDSILIDEARTPLIISGTRPSRTPRSTRSPIA